MKLYNKLKDLELYHQVGLFITIMFLTIAITRFGVLIYNPNPLIFDFEIHHFDYGILLLFTTALFMLFGSKKTLANLILTSIAFGLILDEIWFIRGNIFNPVQNPGDIALYNSTLPYVTAVLILTAIIVAIVGNKSKKSKK